MGSASLSLQAGQEGRCWVRREVIELGVVKRNERNPIYFPGLKLTCNSVSNECSNFRRYTSRSFRDGVEGRTSLYHHRSRGCV